VALLRHCAAGLGAITEAFLLECGPRSSECALARARALSRKRLARLAWAGATDGVTSPDARYQRSRSRVADLMLFIHQPTVISCGWRLKANH
jgi:hypothetical protein